MVSTSGLCIHKLRTCKSHMIGTSQAINKPKRKQEHTHLRYNHFNGLVVYLVYEAINVVTKTMFSLELLFVNCILKCMIPFHSTKW